MPKIRAVSFLSGIIITGALVLYVLWESFVDTSPPVPGRVDRILVGLLLALGAGCIAALGVGAILLVGRAYSKVVVTPAGLYVQAALWRKDSVQWAGIGSADIRKVNGWRYLYITSMLLSRKVAVSLEVDKPEEFARLVALYTDVGNPIRSALNLVPGVEQR